MRRLVIAALFGISLIATSCAQQRPRGNRPPPGFNKPVANPSAIVASEIRFARLAQEKGQWTSFRETLADGALMFVPELTLAAEWLKGRADPPAAVTWQPHKIFMSCDGSLAASTGAWQRPDGSTGYFTTLWQRQKDGDYRWIFDHGDRLDEPLPEPDFITTEVGDCKGKLTEELPPSGVTATRAFGNSAERTFAWSAVAGTQTSTLTVRLYQDGAYRTVIEDVVKHEQ